MGSSDVEGLYPACKALLSGKLVKETVLKSKMKTEGINYREAARYCAMKYSKSEIFSNGLTRIIPHRRYRKGTKPGVKGTGPKSKESDDEELWIFPLSEPTEKEKRQLIACCLEIAVRAIFTLHLYQFGGKVYRQLDGGPIGVRLAGAVARCVMGEWDARINTIMAEHKLSAWLIKRYVDDMLLIMSALKLGVRWCPACKQLAFSKEWEEVDRIEDLSHTDRTMKVIMTMMNDIFKDIQVTYEIPEKQTDQKLPVLDFKCWVNHQEPAKPCAGKNKNEPASILLYTHYEKPMSSKYTIMKTSAMGENSKIQSLANDTIRRMKNVTERLDQQERNNVVDDYARKLLQSGYGKDTVKKVIKSGLQGYEKIRKKSKEGTGRIHRNAKYSLPSRYKKKLIGKSTWFLAKKKELDGLTDTPSKLTPARSRSRPPPEGRKNDTTTAQPNCSTNTTVTVLFIPYTVNGILAKKLREAELELFPICNNKVKIVEKVGRSFKSILSKPNPWQEMSCAREKCIACRSEKGRGKCKNRSIVYKTQCLPCKMVGKERIYIGESARSSFERGEEHERDYKNEKEESHMHCHAVEEHGMDQDKPMFSMEIVRCHKTPLYRQLHEAILISKNEPIALNSKTEYNRCLLPRLSVMMGETEKKPSENNKDVHDEYEESIENDNKRRHPENLTRVSKKRKIEKKESSRKRKEIYPDEETPSKRQKVIQTYPRIAKHFCQTPASIKTKPTSKDRTSSVPKTRNLIEIFESIKAKNKETLEKISTPSPSPNPTKSPKIEAKIRIFDNPPHQMVPSSAKLTRQDGPEATTQVKPLQAKFPPKKPLAKKIAPKLKTKNNPGLTPKISNFFKMEDRTRVDKRRRNEDSS